MLLKAKAEKNQLNTFFSEDLITLANPLKMTLKKCMQNVSHWLVLAMVKPTLNPVPMSEDISFLPFNASLCCHRVPMTQGELIKDLQLQGPWFETPLRQLGPTAVLFQ